MANGKALFAFLILTACAGAVAIDAGCSTYGNLRLSMPTLGNDPVSEWVAVLDNAMTGACR